MKEGHTKSKVMIDAINSKNKFYLCDIIIQLKLLSQVITGVQNLKVSKSIMQSRSQDHKLNSVIQKEEKFLCSVLASVKADFELGHNYQLWLR